MARTATPGAVAALVGVKPVTIRKWAAEGRIPCDVLAGGHRRFDPDEVRAAIDGTGHLRAKVVEHLRSEVRGWPVRPVSAVLFGSVARGQGQDSSDVDLLLVFRAGDARRPEVRRAMLAMRDGVSHAFGHDLDPVVVSTDQLDQMLHSSRRFLAAVVEDGIDVGDTPFVEVLAEANRSSQIPDHGRTTA